jgi:hypothetical protein
MSQISTSDIRKTELDMEIILSEDDTTIYVKLTGFENNADALAQTNAITSTELTSAGVVKVPVDENAVTFRLGTVGGNALIAITLPLLR